MQIKAFYENEAKFDQDKSVCFDSEISEEMAA